MPQLIIIGGGPAGLSAAIYAGRAGIKTLILSKDFGGQLAEKPVPIENYPGFENISGPELMAKFKAHAQKFNVEIKLEKIAKVEKKEKLFAVICESGKRYEAPALIAASGAVHKKLNVRGEEEFTGKGVSYCVTCDGALFPGKKVAVVGAGNSGIEAAIALTDFASKVYVLEYGAEPQADKLNLDKARGNKKIEMIFSAALKEIKGDKFVKSVIYEDRVSGQQKMLEVEGVFVEIGYRAESGFLKELTNINERGEVIVDPKTTAANVPGLFVAGDASDILHKQIIIAAAEGAKAALSAQKYLKHALQI